MTFLLGKSIDRLEKALILDSLESSYLAIKSDIDLIARMNDTDFYFTCAFLTSDKGDLKKISTLYKHKLTI